MTARSITLGTTVFFMVVLLAPGCVKKSTHQRTLDELAQARAQAAAQETDLEGQVAQWQARYNAEVRARQASETDLRNQLASLENTLERVRTERDDAQSRYDAERVEAQRLQTLLSRQGSEYLLLEQRMASLAAIEQEIRQRNAIYEEVIGRFQSLIDAGRLTVAIERGRMVIKLPQDILFESGSATLGADGRTTLGEVAEVIAEFEDRRFQVEGHTDNVPIATARFPSNWELSTGRALSVVRLLVERGVAPENVSGAGYGEFQPVADNDDSAGRRLNRRIEIVMLPNLDVIADAGLRGGG